MPQILILFLISLSFGCSSHSGTTGSLDSPGGQSITLDIFAARGFLGGTEYERYHLSNNLLWRECGSISRADSAPKQKRLEGDDVFTRDPNFTIHERRVEKISSQIRARLDKKIRPLLNELTNRKYREPLPGSVFSLAGPGFIELYVQQGEATERLITSVDALADRETDSLVYGYDLISGVRSLGPTICGSRTFFGIGKTELK